jgi:hypothetical protein
MFKYLFAVPANYTNGTPGDFVASGSSLLLPRASIVRYAMQGQQSGAQERRREGGTRERGKGRRGTRAGGGKAAGAWVIGG